MSTTLDAKSIDQHLPRFTPSEPISSTIPSQTAHRIRLIEFWDIKPGSTVLEVGCGQGDCTVVLAEAVGPNGHVTAVDPAPLDYGTPFTLGQSQDHILQGALGDRITFVQSDPIEYLKSKGTTYDVAVLSHSLWYFSSAAQVIQTFQALSTRAKKICIAEHGMRVSHIQQVPHLLAAITQGQLWSAVYTQAQQFAHFTNSDPDLNTTASTSGDSEPTAPAAVSKSVPSHFEPNVRTPLSPAQYKTLLKEAGLSIVKASLGGEDGVEVGASSSAKEGEEKEMFITPEETLADGRWEVEACERLDLETILRGRLEDDDAGRKKTESELVELKLQNGVIISSRDAMLAQVKMLERGSKDVRAMDVWVAVVAVEGVIQFWQ